jgi:hypothetical protein
MPKLSISERIRVINLYNSDQFKGIKYKYQAVSEAAKLQNICISPRRLFDIIKRWENESKCSFHLKISKYCLILI